MMSRSTPIQSNSSNGGGKGIKSAASAAAPAAPNARANSLSSPDHALASTASSVSTGSRSGSGASALSNSSSNSLNATRKQTATSISPAVSVPNNDSTTLLPFHLLSKEEQKSFAARFQAAQKSPHLVRLQISALDGLIQFLKQKRENARRIVEQSHAEIAAIEREQAMMHIRLDPLAARIQANEARRRELLDASAEASQHMGGIIASTGAHVEKTKHRIDAFRARELKQEMDFARGIHNKLNPQQIAAALAGKPR
jgi:hypothetical protein